MTRSFRARAISVTLTVLAAVAFVVGTAWAHVTLQRSSPAAGAMLESSPVDIRLWFSGAAQLSLTSVTLTRGDGAAVSLGPIAEVVDGDRSVMVAPVQGELPGGSYTVAWQTAAADGHPVRGRFTFTVEAAGDAPAPAAGLDTRDPGTPAPNEAMPLGTDLEAGEPTARAILAWASRWLGYAGTLAIIGTVAVGWLLVPPPRRPNDDPEIWVVTARRAAGVGAIAAAVLLFGALGRLATDGVALLPPGATLSDGGLMTLLGTGWGRGWALQVGAAIVAAAALGLTSRGRALWTLAAVAALAAAVAPALTGHSATVQPRWLGIGLSVAHVLTAGLWIGSLFVLIAAALPVIARARDGRRGEDAFALVSAFSKFALVGAGILALTGVTLAWTQLSAVGELWRSDYGITLLIKLGFVSLVLALGAWNWRREKPRLAADDQGISRLRRSGAVELTLAALVLAVTARLVITPPPTHEQPANELVLPPPNATAPQPTQSGS